jgi:hypothetical protein
MGLFSNEKIAPLYGNLVDTLSARLEKLCSFEPGGRDLVMLQHKVCGEMEGWLGRNHHIDSRAVW